MNSNFTQNLEQLEKYSLQMIDFYSQLPDSFFDDPMLEPSQKIVDCILQYSKNSNSKDYSEKLFRYSFN